MQDVKINTVIREEQVRLLKGLISHLDAGTNVDAKGILENPADTYTSEERFAEEKDNFLIQFITEEKYQDAFVMIVATLLENL